MVEKTEQGVDIALIQADIKYMKSDIADIKISSKKLSEQLSTMLEHYITRNEVESRFKRIQEEIDKRFDGAHKRLDEKADQKELDGVQSNLTWVVRVVVGAVLMAIIGVVVINK